MLSQEHVLHVHVELVGLGLVTWIYKGAEIHCIECVYMYNIIMYIV